ncbi:MAG: glycosyltransferase [Proteobacteria bacterium]|nr:glycosyltransferase [Pseudomonadota bacterium]
MTKILSDKPLKKSTKTKLSSERTPFKPEISIVVPIYNEEETLPILWERLTKTMDAYAQKNNTSYEIIFTNDGSKDRSALILKSYFDLRPHQVRIIEFNGNFGQHMAILAAFERVRGQIIVNLDADLQNPPEEIPKVLSKMNEGYDYVGSYRDGRKDNIFRTYSSRLMNKIRGLITDIVMTDQGCMLRAYSREIVDEIARLHESSTFIPALAYKLAGHPTEIPVRHDPRAAGDSKYSLYKLIRVTFDLMTSFSLVPLQLFTFCGFIVSFLSGLLVIYLFIRRLTIGPEAEGVFTLFAILYFLIGLLLVGIGIMGEYLGRVFQVSSKRRGFQIRKVYEKLD